MAGLSPRLRRCARGSLKLVNSYDALGYGTHVVLDGFRADTARLADPAVVASVLTEIAGAMELTGTADRLLVQRPDDREAGHSVGLIDGESHVCLHTFGGLRKLTLDAFSTRFLPVEAITGVFVERFSVGRYEGQVHGRSRLLPRQAEALARALDGDRQYARVRLRDVLGS